MKKNGLENSKNSGKDCEIFYANLLDIHEDFF